MRMHAIFGSCTECRKKKCRKGCDFRHFLLGHFGRVFNTPITFDLTACMRVSVSAMWACRRALRAHSVFDLSQMFFAR